MFRSFVRNEGREILLESALMKEWFPDSSKRNELISLLRAENALFPGVQAASSTRQIQVSSLQRGQYYVITKRALTEALKKYDAKRG